MSNVETRTRLLSMREAGQFAGVCEKTIYFWIKDDGLPVIKLGRLRRIRPEDLDAFIEGKREVRHESH